MFPLMPNPEPSHDFIESAGFRFWFALFVQEDTEFAWGRSPVRREVRGG
jgi:hypothetical protein